MLVKTQHLAGNRNTRAGSHLSSAYLTMSFGPPKLIVDSGVGIKGITVGLVQDLSVFQQRQVARFMEIGNKEQWLVTSKTRNSLQLRRVLYDGPTLLKYVAYALMDGGDDPWKMRGTESIGADHDLTQGASNVKYEMLMERLGYPEDKYPSAESPGVGDFWINLASELFSHPIGILLSLKQKLPTGKLSTYGAVYLENCLISSHIFQVMAENRFLSEAVSIEFTNAIPIGNNRGKTVQEIELMLREALR